MPRKASSCGLGPPRGAAYVVCHGYPGSYTPQLVPERLVPVVQRRLLLVRTGVNNAEQSSLWSNHHAELPSCVGRRRAV